MFEEEQKENTNKQKIENSSSGVFMKKDIYGNKRIFGVIPYNKTIKIIFLVLFIIYAIFFTYWLINKINTDSNGKIEVETYKIPDNESDEGDNRLGGGLPNTSENNNSNNGSTLLDDIEVEYLSFSDFYKKPNKTYERSIGDYELPLNVKVDAVNYYDVSRKFNLDDGVNSFNQNGFAIFSNPYKEEFNDFYGAYDWLYEKNIPIAITSDFLSYYYQNELNKIFKEVEANIFYDNLWEINKSLYDEAKYRYEFNLREKGNINDPVLEAQRMVVAYLAVSLELLKPSPDQVNENTDINDQSKFNPKDITIYNFNLPYYLNEDVIKEVKLIREHKIKTKSPVLLYDRNYNNFIVPKEYQENARLNNFYLTSKWLQSVFPLYHINDNCPDCLLDQDDWRINMIASQILSQDISKDEKIKNKWARIYKVIAFFKGLRQDLTYVNYRDSFNDNMDIENFDEWFDKSNDYIDERLYNLQSEISKYQFSDIKGGYNEINENNKANIGLKILSDYYWPNSYIFNNLTYPEVGFHKSEGKDLGLVTSCENRSIGAETRCSGFGLDVINLVNNIESDDDYWKRNTNYEDYNKQAEKLKNQLNKSNNWQENNYWSNLNLIDSMFDFSSDNDPRYTQTEAWEDRLVSSSLGHWINFQLEPDLLGLYSLYSDKKNNVSINTANRINKYNYIEPNLKLLDNLIASTNMISQMFTALQINEEVASAGINLNKMKGTFNDLRNIIIKQNKGEDISTEEHTMIQDLSREYVVREASNKTLRLGTDNNNAELIADIEGIKIMALLRYYEDKPVLVLGPIFNYQESRP
ncbi:DUF3160 domain-containing protein [Patescibacteria group bacterium]|nr:DUF3160 domain-containing protein [Patescibacteria group bacterium]